MTEITLTPIKQIFYNPENDYRILSCIPENYNEIEVNKYGNFTLSGSNLNGLQLNQVVKLKLEPDVNSKYPASYVVAGYAGISFDHNIHVESQYELLLLEQLMTKQQAKNVNDAYPHFVEMVLNNKETEIDPKNIYNVAKYRLNEYCKKIKENFGVFLFFSVAQKYNINDFNIISKFACSYENPEVWENAYQSNPYQVLTNSSDWSFEKIDYIVLSALPQFEISKERAQYCIYSFLKENETEGDTCVDARILKDAFIEIYPKLQEFITDIIKNDSLIHYDPSTKTCGFQNTYEAELNIATNILNRVNYPYADNMNWEQFKIVDGFEMTSEQNKICQIANDESIGMMIGPAGSGKTSATRALIQMLEHYGKTYILLAPTGIAAKRLRESTHRKASTIHMALARGEFIENSFDYVIIDEMSCVGVHLLSEVFTLISQNTKIIFICDNAQLASISCGNIVEDIINSNKVPIVTLTKIFRYGSSGIATIATNTRNGSIKGRGDVSFEENDYEYIEIGNKPIATIVESYEKLLMQGYTRNDILILCPFNKSNLGTYTINEAIQKYFNPNNNEIVLKLTNKPVKEIHYKVGDRVINTHNNYRALTAEFNESTGDFSPSDQTTAIMNGDIGVIRSIIHKDNNDYEIYIQFDESLVVFTPKEIKYLLLGYCITCHKSQGTQAKAIIFVMGKNHIKMSTRNLVYVAVSRAQEKLIEIVDKNCIEEGLKIVETIDRTTWLKSLLS